MNILMIYPKYPDTFWSFKNVLKFYSRKALYPPLGLMTVSSMLPQKWDKKLIDLNVCKKLNESDILWADMIFISAMLVQKKNSQEIINLCKIFNKKIVAGGPAFTTSHQEFEGVDHYVLNEAEITLPQFLDDLGKNQLKKFYTSDKKPNLHSTPIPDWSLIRLKDYVTMPIQYSRGCPFNCEFCDIIVMNGRIPRTKANHQIIDELKSLYNSGWKGSVFIVDDNFIGNKLKAKSLLIEIVKWQKSKKYPFTFLTEASINLADDEELMKLMVCANFNKVFLGLETPNIKSLQECNKKQNTVTSLTKSVQKIQKNGLQVMGGFIVGFDNDGENIFEQQIKFIQKIGVVTAMVGILNVLPQTRLWHRLKNENRLIKNGTGNNTEGVINFIPKMGKDKLLKGYSEIFSTIYSPKEYYTRINTFLKNYKPAYKNKICFDDIRAFIRSIWRIGIFSKARYYYWKLFIKILITKKQSFGVAIELAIHGLHFQQIQKNLRLVSAKSKSFS